MASNHSTVSFGPFYQRVLSLLEGEGIPFLIGGAFAMAHYTGIERDTKDLDLFVRARDRGRCLRAAAGRSLLTSLDAPHWLAKIVERGRRPRSAASMGGRVVDIIFGSGNGLAPVDDAWFAHAEAARLNGREVRVVPAEEIIWQKAFIMERHRFDGADIAHLLRARGGAMDWERLLERFLGHDHVLLAHVLLFRYAFPADRGAVPEPVFRELSRRVARDARAARRAAPFCRGTFLSSFEYRPDVRGGLRDARLGPAGPLTRRELDLWNKHLGA